MELNGLWLFFTQLANSDLGLLLPISPFQRFLANWEGMLAIQKYMHWVNWFVPIGTMVNIMVVWLAAIASFYGIQGMLRWIHLID